MKIRNWLFALGALALAFTSQKPAAASTIDYTVNFGASNFSAFNGNPVPANFVLGQFTLTLDPSAAVFDAGTIALDFLTPLGSSSPLLFSYNPASDVLNVGALGSAGGLTFGTSDFYLRISNFTSGTPTFAQFLYSISGTTDAFTTSFGLVYVTSVATTPIPAALPLFAAALGGLGLVGWRRRKSAA
ncbi:hypothetical protein [Dongia sp.]|uniref:hypothetical protein n=1 Tax=Dongia sp. TaxID=1977262 RepID=UPI00375254DE